MYNCLLSEATHGSASMRRLLVLDCVIREQQGLLSFLQQQHRAEFSLHPLSLNQYQFTTRLLETRSLRTRLIVNIWGSRQGRCSFVVELLENPPNVEIRNIAFVYGYIDFVAGRGF